MAIHKLKIFADSSSHELAAKIAERPLPPEEGADNDQG